MPELPANGQDLDAKLGSCKLMAGAVQAFDTSKVCFALRRRTSALGLPQM